MSLIRCRGVTRRYQRPDLPTLTAVDHVDLEVGDEEFVAILGPSGSGKTTLLGLLAGLDLPDDGDVEVLGHALRRLSATERARLRQRRIGVVFQSFGLVGSLRVGENVELPLALAGVPEAERRERAERALHDVELKVPFDGRIDELSGGERQRVGIARALVAEPAIVLADEPTGSLDSENGGIVLSLLRDAVERHHVSVVLVTHDPLSAAQAGRRYLMHDGRLRPEAAA